MAFQTPNMATKMVPEALWMSLFAPTIALPQTDKPNFERAAVIPEGIVNSNSNSNNNSHQGVVVGVVAVSNSSAAPSL